MKTNTLIATALAAVLTISCGDRKTKDDPNEDVEIGMEVEVVYVKATDDVTIPYFQPVGV